MPIDPATLKAAITEDLSAVSDEMVRDHIVKLLVEPRPRMLTWDYGAPGEQYLGWMVLEDRGGGIA